MSSTTSLITGIPQRPSNLRNSTTPVTTPNVGRRGPSSATTTTTAATDGSYASGPCPYRRPAGPPLPGAATWMMTPP
ncbi:uncharacterized protein PHACADRAFT_159775 [Phanerochaete carnosa HHB-10118-sp]|uniref:Uncharacterized protein n=1 Tax=Phanerochaete carnosa (strain HHB-10118-sp) TaxID=650164 RepID=K5V7D5_PHACS|nr:uncharacterized protein PHACADRAFT_159775 [Phanerochaete carnosa HHB-10118-sp]EKM58686.1 hypothetical protein PHACADRAFT_159775 [Phanerochaete carnosa HHB-10118-sp]